MWRSENDTEGAKILDGIQPSQEPETDIVKKWAPTNGVCPLQVDDFLFMGTKRFFTETVAKILAAKPFGAPETPEDLGGMTFSGTHLFRGPDGLVISQVKYVESLVEIPIPKGMKVDGEPVNEQQNG